MSKFIWVRDREKREHFINVDHIVRVTKVPAGGSYSTFGYIVMNEGTDSQKTIDLSSETYDSFEDVINKIQIVLA